ERARLHVCFDMPSMILKTSRSLCVLLSFLFCCAFASPQQGKPALSLPGLYNPVADPAAVVVLGNARFTVLTPQMIRLEWAADGKFEDHPSLVFLNRHLPVPKFTHSEHKNDEVEILDLKTDALSLSYRQSGDGKFTSDNLHIDLTLNGNQVTWHPGLEDKGNLQGTTRTLDGALGGKTREPIDPG